MLGHTKFETIENKTGTSKVGAISKAQTAQFLNRKIQFVAKHLKN